MRNTFISEYPIRKIFEISSKIVFSDLNMQKEIDVQTWLSKTKKFTPAGSKAWALMCHSLAVENNNNKKFAFGGNRTLVFAAAVIDVSGWITSL